MAKKKNYYFNEKETADKILEYQKIVETTADEKGRKIVINKTSRVEQLETEITKEVKKIVKAVIFLYHYERWMEYEELESLGIQACFQNYLKFNPEFGSAFNFFSLIVKRCLYGITTRNSKKRERNVYLEDLGDAVHSARQPNIDEFIDNLNSELHEIVDSNFLGKKRRKYILVSDVICDYLHKTKIYVSKTDMYKFCGCYSLRTIDVRQFCNDIRPYYSALEGMIEKGYEQDGLTPNIQANGGGSSGEMMDSWKE